MTSSDEEFQQWLLGTFREEADEILTGISNGLIELEKAGPDPKPEMVEQVFRKTHSLKGAARAVNIREIESICQNAENVFSLIKRGVLVPDPDLFDLLHKSIASIYSILSGEQIPGLGSSEIIYALRDLTEDVFSRNPPDNDVSDNIPVPSPRVPDTSLLSLESESKGIRKSDYVPSNLLSSANSLSGSTSDKVDIFGQPGGDFSHQQIQGGRMVRIASHKLDRLIAGSEDLLSTRLFLTHRMRELEDVMSTFSFWRWNQTQIEGDLHKIRDCTYGNKKDTNLSDIIPSLERMVDFLTFDREFVTRLQHDLAIHIRSFEVDRSALESSTSEISDLIHDAVLIPVAGILTSFSKFVREYSRSIGKLVDLEVVGKDIEMDRRILEAIKTPLMHLIHNSIDHGIEYPDIREEQGKPPRGKLEIRVTPHAGSKVVIEVIDDGIGIDPKMIRQAAVRKGVISSKEELNITDEEALWLIFRSGLSTKTEVTDLSGRGLGLPIVDDSVTRLGGELMVSSELFKGTNISIILPVRLATLRGVVVRSGSQTYIFPIQQIGKVIRADPASIIIQGNRMVLRTDDEIIRIIRLTEILRVPDTTSSTDGPTSIPIVTFEYAGRQIACIVDEVIQEQEIVVRPLGSLLRRVKRITGAVILGDGSVAMVLDPLEIIQEAFKTGHQFTPNSTSDRLDKKILVVEDSTTSRALLKRTLEMDGYLVQTAYDGIDAMSKLNNNEFDIVVSDIDMPRMNGYTLTEKIRADDRFRHIPVVLITSMNSPLDKDYGKTVGANAYIAKNQFEKTSFLAIIKDLLNNK